MNENVFNGSTAWFSASVAKTRQEEWRLHGGKVTRSIDDANYIFSDDSDHSDTKRAFESLNDEVVILKSTWIRQAINSSSDGDILDWRGIQKFVLLPMSVQQEWDLYTSEERYRAFLREQQTEVEKHFEEFKQEVNLKRQRPSVSSSGKLVVTKAPTPRRSTISNSSTLARADAERFKKHNTRSRDNKVSAGAMSPTSSRVNHDGMMTRNNSPRRKTIESPREKTNSLRRKTTKSPQGRPTNSPRRKLDNLPGKKTMVPASNRSDPDESKTRSNSNKQTQRVVSTPSRTASIKPSTPSRKTVKKLSTPNQQEHANNFERRQTRSSAFKNVIPTIAEAVSSRHLTGGDSSQDNPITDDDETECDRSKSSKTKTRSSSITRCVVTTTAPMKTVSAIPPSTDRKKIAKRSLVATPHTRSSITNESEHSKVKSSSSRQMFGEASQDSQDSDNEVIRRTKRLKSPRKTILDTDSDASDSTVKSKQKGKYTLRGRTPRRTPTSKAYPLRKRASIDYADTDDGDLTHDSQDVEMVKSTKQRTESTSRDSPNKQVNHLKILEIRISDLEQQMLRDAISSQTIVPHEKISDSIVSKKTISEETMQLKECDFTVSKQIGATEGTPVNGTRKRKLFRISSNSLLHDEQTKELSTCVGDKRRSAEQQLSPKEIHDLLNNETQKMISLSGCRNISEADAKRRNVENGVKLAYVGDHTDEQIAESRQTTMEEHKKVIEHKKIGEKGNQKFTYGSFTGFTHIDDLDIPDIQVYDFIVNKDGCRVRLAGAT